MSVTAWDDEQQSIRADHETEKEIRELSDLFHFHDSDLFYAVNQSRVLDLEEESDPSSLDTCEQLHISEPSGDSEAVSRLVYDLRELWSREPKRIARVLELLSRGETGHARRLATCSRRSVELVCGECGEANFVPVTCDSRLCPDCNRRAMGRLIGKYEKAVSTWEEPTLLTLTTENASDIGVGKDEIVDYFGNFRRRIVPLSGGSGEQSWVWKRDGGEPAGDYWKSRLLQRGQHELARSLQSRYVDEGRGIPVAELLRGGFYGVDIKQQDDGTFNIHLHILADMSYIPQPAISEVWEDVTEGSCVVDVRRIDERGSMGEESAIAEVIGYATKPPEFDDIETEVDYALELSGSRMVQPFGSLYGDTPSSAPLVCQRCEEVPLWWEYEGFVDVNPDPVFLEESRGVDPP